MLFVLIKDVTTPKSLFLINNGFIYVIMSYYGYILLGLVLYNNL